MRVGLVGRGGSQTSTIGENRVCRTGSGWPQAVGGVEGDGYRNGAGFDQLLPKPGVAVRPVGMGNVHQLGALCKLYHVDMI